MHQETIQALNQQETQGNSSYHARRLLIRAEDIATAADHARERIAHKFGLGDYRTEKERNSAKSLMHSYEVIGDVYRNISEVVLSGRVPHHGSLERMPNDYVFPDPFLSPLVTVDRELNEIFHARNDIPVPDRAVLANEHGRFRQEVYSAAPKEGKKPGILAAFFKF